MAYGYLETEFKPNLSVNYAYKIAIQAIAAAIKRNAGTGDGINAVIIDKDGYREVSKEMKDCWHTTLMSNSIYYLMKSKSGLAPNSLV